MALPDIGVTSASPRASSYGPGFSMFERWWVRVASAAALAATLELGASVAVFPTAASDEAGLLAAWLGVYWVFALLTMPIAGALGLISRSAYFQRALEIGGATPLLLAPVLSSAVALLIVESTAWTTLQIRIGEIRTLILTCGMIAAGLVAHAVIAGLRRMAPALARLLDEYGLRALAVVAAAAIVWVIHGVLAPANADEAVALAGAAQLALLSSCSTWALSTSTRVPRAVAVLLGAIWLAAPPIWSASPHARMVVRGHCPTATSLWAPLDRLTDFDGDGAGARWLLGTDCAEFDASRGPLVREIPSDGVDQDCWGGDAQPEPERAASPPWTGCAAPKDASVLLISIDALRADALDPAITPELAAFAAHAALFERAYAPASMTGGTTLSVMTDRATIDLNARNVYTDPEIVVSRTFAEDFRRSGYRTFAFLPFELHPAVLAGFDPPEHARPRDRVLETRKRLMAAELSNQLMEEIAGSPQKFLAWVHYPDLHAPYVLARDADETTAPGYLRAAAYTDLHVGRVLRWLHSTEQLQKTIVVLASDHGEQLGKRGREGHGPFLFEEGIRIPLVLWVPGCSPRRVPYPVNLRHLAGTLSALFGAPRSATTWFMPGPLPVVVEEPNAAWNGVKRAVIVGHHKLLVDMRLGGKMLFDLAADPGELENLYASRPDIVASLESAYQRWLDSPLGR